MEITTPLRLRTLFAPLALAAMPFVTTLAISGDETTPDSSPQTKSVLKKRTLDYRSFGQPLPRNPPAQHARAFHIEEGLISNYSATYASHRHAETAAYAMAYAANAASGKSIPVTLYDATPFMGTVPMDGTVQQRESAVVNQHAFSRAITISTSMNIKASRMEIDTDNFERHRQAWRNSHAIMLQSAGNAGTYCKMNKTGPAEQQELSTFQFADTYIRVGSAKLDSAGQPIIHAQSSCAAADLIALNPYEQGIYYRFRVSLPEFQNLVQRYGDDPREKEVFAKPEKARAFLESLRKSDNVSGDPMTNISGNSFITPAVGGYIAAAYESCPQMSAYDLLAIAFARATPLTRSEDGIVPEYKWNGRMMFDDARVGFGYLDTADYGSTVKSVCTILRDNPQLKTVETPIKADTNTLRVDPLARDIPEGQKAYTVRIDQNAFAFRLMLEMNMNESSRNPFSMKIRNPQGTTYDFQPAVKPGIAKGLALMATNAFFGNDTKGTWTLIVDKDVNLDSINMNFSAVKPNGLADEIVNKFSRPKEQPAISSHQPI